MNNADELDQLKKQFAELKQQFDELRKFVSVQETDSGRKILLIDCSTILLRNPEDPAQLQGMLCGGKEGPCLSLWGGDSKARILLEVRDDAGTIDLYQPELKLGVHVGLDSQNRPCVGVFDQGKPRAALKCTEKGGAVTVVHDDGHVRAAMLSEQASAEIFTVNPDMKMAVKISSNGQNGGGLLTVNHPNGKAAVILSSLPDTGCVLLNDPGGNVKHSLPDHRKEE